MKRIKESTKLKIMDTLVFIVTTILAADIIYVFVTTELL
jgi:hypothetical protein